MRGSCPGGVSPGDRRHRSPGQRPRRRDAYAVVRVLAGTLRRAPFQSVEVVTATYPDITRFLDLRPRTRARVEDGMRRFNAAVRSVARGHNVVLMEKQLEETEDLEILGWDDPTFTTDSSVTEEQKEQARTEEAPDVAELVDEVREVGSLQLAGRRQHRRVEAGTAERHDRLAVLIVTFERGKEMRLVADDRTADVEAVITLQLLLNARYGLDDRQLGQVTEAARELAEDLTETLHLNELFTGVLAHDLRNPLGAVLVATQLLDRSDADPALRSRQREIISRPDVRTTHGH